MMGFCAKKYSDFMLKRYTSPSDIDVPLRKYMLRGTCMHNLEPLLCGKW